MSSEIQNAKSMPESDKGCVSVSKNQGASRVAFWGVILFSTSAVLAGSGLFAGPKGTAAERSGDGPAVIELFTSQGCYSCPPAEKLLGELIESHPDVVALEFHVDYWDSLVYGTHGTHKDPFSDKENTYRQQLYNMAGLDGRPGVYTPQMVINGNYATVGSDGRVIRKGIDVLDRPFVNLTVSYYSGADSASGQRGLQVEIAGGDREIPASAQVWLAVFDIEKTTKISTGENHDKTLTSHHIVRDFDQLTSHTGFADQLSAANTLEMVHQIKLGEGQGCAVLVQDARLGSIYGAAYCPEELYY